MKKLLCLALVAVLFTITGMGCDKGNTSKTGATGTTTTTNKMATGATTASPK